MPYLDEEYKIDCEYKITYDTLVAASFPADNYILNYIPSFAMPSIYKCQPLNGKIVLLVKFNAEKAYTIGTLLTKKLYSDSNGDWYKVILPIDYSDLTASNSNGDALTLDHTEYSIGE